MKEAYQLNSGEAWSIKEGEMTETEVRGLGHLLYTGMFTRMPEVIRSALLEDYKRVGNNPSDFDVRVIQAERFVDKFAILSGLNAEILKRWSNNASIELARAILPFELERLKKLVEDSWSATDLDMYREGIIEPIIRVSQNGILALVQDHNVLVAEAFYMGRGAIHNSPLDISLATSFFGEGD